MSLATLGDGNVTEDLLDVVAAPDIGGLLAGFAGDPSAHGNGLSTPVCPRATEPGRCRRRHQVLHIAGVGTVTIDTAAPGHETPAGRSPTWIVRRYDELDGGGMNLEAVRTALSDLSCLTSWIETRRMILTRRLNELSTTSPSVAPVDILCSSSLISRSEARRDLSRADTLSLIPQLDTALGQGRISPAHVDAVSRTVSGLDETERKALAEHGDWLKLVASHATPDNMSRAVRSTVARIRHDAGISHLEQQRQNAYVRHWIDRETGMVCLRGELDPENGLRIVGAIQRKVEQLQQTGAAMSHRDHIQAVALCALVDQSGSSKNGRDSGHSRTEVSVIIDLETLAHGLHERSLVHTGTDIDLPVDVIRRMACEAQIIPVVLDSKGVTVDVGRSSRVATKHQRRALEAMHQTCAMPHCAVPVSQCEPHHVIPWARGGPTNLANLIPLCAGHHRTVHEGGWTVGLNGDTREITVKEPGRPTRARGFPESAIRPGETGRT